MPGGIWQEYTLRIGLAVTLFGCLGGCAGNRWVEQPAQPMVAYGYTATTWHRWPYGSDADVARPIPGHTLPYEVVPVPPVNFGQPVMAPFPSSAPASGPTLPSPVAPMSYAPAAPISYAPAGRPAPISWPPQAIGTTQRPW